MYLIKDIDRKKIKLFKDTNVSLNTLKLFYHEFYPTSNIIIFKNYYPESFIAILFKNTDVINYKNQHFYKFFLFFHYSCESPVL